MGIQKLILQTNDLDTFVAYLKLTISMVLNSLDEIAIKTLDDKAREDGSLHIPTWYGDEKKAYPIIRVSGWFRKKEKENSYFNGYKPWQTINRQSYGPDTSVIVDLATRQTIGILKINEPEWIKQFLEIHGDGYNEGFNEMDGSVSVGYQITSGHTFPKEITISLIHIYHGK